MRRARLAVSASLKSRVAVEPSFEQLSSSPLRGWSSFRLSCGCKHIHMHTHTIHLDRNNLGEHKTDGHLSCKSTVTHKALHITCHYVLKQLSIPRDFPSPSALISQLHAHTHMRLRLFVCVYTCDHRVDQWSISREFPLTSALMTQSSVPSSEAGQQPDSVVASLRLCDASSSSSFKKQLPSSTSF
jgi:hypothetical protein